MERIRTPKQDEEKLPFTIKLKTINDETVKKSWDSIALVISNPLTTRHDKTGDHNIYSSKFD